MQDIGHHQADEYGIDDGSGFHEQVRPGYQAVHQKGPQHDGGDRVAGDAKGQKWNQGSAGDRGVGGLRSRCPSRLHSQGSNTSRRASRTNLAERGESPPATRD